MQRQDMNAQDIFQYLAALGQELQDMGMRQVVRILIVGGAFMLTQIRNRPTTRDIDILLKDIDDPLSSPLYQPFKTAVEQLLHVIRYRIIGLMTLLAMPFAIMGLCRKEPCGENMVCWKYMFHRVSIF